MKIMIINGPNLNLLGLRETKFYPSKTLAEIISTTENTLKQQFATVPDLIWLQSNAEHVIIEQIQMAYQEKYDYIIINAAAYTHTSVSIRDALLAVDIPFIEVHLSNIYAREEFRKISYLTDIALGSITGLGASAYLTAINALINREVFNAK